MCANAGNSQKVRMCGQHCWQLESMLPVNGIQAWHMGEKQTGRKDRLGEKAGHPKHKAS